MNGYSFEKITNFKFVVFDGSRQLAGFNNPSELIAYLSVLDATNITISILYNNFYFTFSYEEFYQAFMVAKDNGGDGKETVDDSSDN